MKNTKYNLTECTNNIEIKCNCGEILLSTKIIPKEKVIELGNGFNISCAINDEISLILGAILKCKNCGLEHDFN